MKAKFTENGKVLYQNLYDLTEEAENKGYKTEDEVISYLHDCFVVDENRKTNDFSEWLDSIDEWTNRSE